MVIGDIYIKLPTSIPQLDVCSFYYIGFVFLCFCLCRPFKSVLRPYVLLLSSLFFLYTFSVDALKIVLVLGIASYLFGLLISRYRNKKMLFLSIIPFVLVLTYYKYYGLLTNTSIIVPLGLSFYSFKIISYQVDVYKEKIEPEKNVIFFMDFVLFFPCITAGPINRFDNFIKTLKTKEEFDYKKTKGGAFEMFLGIFEKMVFSDFISSVVTRCFNTADVAGTNILFGIVMYAFYIYLDFDAISNIALGTAKVFGFDLGKNFNTPYLSSTLSEFWKRWHISLSSWLRDYIYIPLGGSRKGLLRKYLNIMAVFAVSGIWHGSTWNFLVWGLLNALVQIVEDLILKPFKNLQLNKYVAFIFKLAGISINFCIVCFLWLVFRYATLTEVKEVISLIFVNQTFSYEVIGLTRNEFFWTIAIITITVLTDILRYFFDMIVTFNKLPFVLRWFVYATLIVMFLVFGMFGGTFASSDFIYRFF